VPTLEARAITKDFAGVRALDCVSLRIESGEIHALCGENGAGKSTLIRVFSGVWRYGTYAGEVVLDGAPIRLDSIRDAELAGIAVIHQELALVPDLSIAENLFLGNERTRRGVLSRREMVELSREQLRQVGLDADPRTRLGDLGGGAQQLVEIAKALLRNARLLILDEPTAALTPSECGRLLDILRRLRERGATIVYISHKLEEVFDIADRVTVLRDGSVVETWPVAELTRDTLIAHMVGRDLDRLYPPRRRVGTADPNGPPPALRVERWSVRSPDGKPLVEDVSFEARYGEVLGVAGLVGAGRTELLMSLFGWRQDEVRGSLRIDGRPSAIKSPRDAIVHGIALVAEDRKRYGVLLDWALDRNISLPSLADLRRWLVIDRARERELADRAVRALDIRASGLDAPVRTLSGGNQQKVVLGKWTSRSPRILLLDEPTRGIDVGAKAEIHALIDRLARDGAAVVMVSSELPEILGMSDRIIVLHRGRLVGSFDEVEGLAQTDVMSLAFQTNGGR